MADTLRRQAGRILQAEGHSRLVDHSPQEARRPAGGRTAAEECSREAARNQAEAQTREAGLPPAGYSSRVTDPRPEETSTTTVLRTWGRGSRQRPRASRNSDTVVLSSPPTSTSIRRSSTNIPYLRADGSNGVRLVPNPAQLPDCDAPTGPRRARHRDAFQPAPVRRGDEIHSAPTGRGSRCSLETRLPAASRYPGAPSRR